MQVSVNASSCTTELVLTTAQQGCSTVKDAALHHAYELVHAHTASCTACLMEYATIELQVSGAIYVPCDVYVSNYMSRF